MGKTKKNNFGDNDKPVREPQIDGNNAPAPDEEKLVELKTAIEKETKKLTNQLDSEQRALKDLSEKIFKDFSDDFARLQGELQVLLLNVSDLNISRGAETVNKEIAEFTGQFNNLRSRISELVEKISIAISESEPETAQTKKPLEAAAANLPPEKKIIEKPAVEVKKPEAAGVLILDEGVLRAPNFSIELPAAIKSGEADIIAENDGWFFIKSKVGDKRSVRVKLAEDGKSVNLYTQGSKGVYSLDAAQRELNKMFGEFKKAAVKEKIPKPKEASKTEPKKYNEEPRPIKEKNIEPEVNVPEIKESIEISQEKLQKIVEYLGDVVSDGNADSNYQKWMDILRTHLPEQPQESEDMKAKRKLVDEKIFQNNLAKVTEHLKLIHDQKVVDNIIRLKKGAEKTKWGKRKAVLDEIFGEKEEDAIKEAPVVEEMERAAMEPGQKPQEEFIEMSPEAATVAPTEELLASVETSETEQAINDVLSMEAVKTAEAQATEAPSEEIAAETANETENAEKIREQNEKIEKLQEKLIETRNKLTKEFINKEKAAGVIGRFKKMFRKGEAKGAEDEAFELAWADYAYVQTELIEANKAQAENLRAFLNEQSVWLQNKIGEYYKGKETVVGKAWRKLGDINLHNYLEARSAQAKQKKEAGEKLGFMESQFYSYSHSHALYKAGAKFLSARTAISLGLLGGGIAGFTGFAEARGLMVGIGTAFGSRQMEDAIQNKIQSRFGNRGDFYSSIEEAEAVLRDKYHLAVAASGERAEEPEDKKMEKRRKKMEKELSSVTAEATEFEMLPIEQKLAKIQEKIASVEAFSYVNGVDLSKDANYQRLTAARDRITEEYLAIKAIEQGDNRAVVRPDDLTDAMAFLESRKTELAMTAEKVSSEKLTRLGKRLISIAAGTVAGTFAYFATLSRAEMFAGHKPEAAAVVAGHEAAPAEAEIASPQEMLQAEPNVATEEEMVRAATPEELAKKNQFFEAAGANKQAVQEFQQYVQAGNSPEKISNAFLVHKGDGIERVLQRQLLLNPQAHGFKGDIRSSDEIRKWAGHEASVIAQKQDLADKYFIYDAKKPQYLVLHEDGNVDIVGQGKLHHVSEIAAAKAREAAEKSADLMKTPEGEAVPVKEVINIKTGQPDIFTDAEQAEYQILVDKGEYDDAMDLLMKCKARGPIYEMPDGTEIHRADIAEWEGDAPKIKVSSGATVEPMYGGRLDGEEIYFAHVEHPVSSDQFYSQEILTQFTQDVTALDDALSQSHVGSSEHAIIANSLKNRIGNFEHATGKKPAEVFGEKFVSDIEKMPVRPAGAPPAEVGHVSTGESLKIGKPLSTYEEAYGKQPREINPEDIFEQAGQEMERINNGFNKFYSKDIPLNNRVSSLKEIMRPGEGIDHNTIQYSLKDDKVLYKFRNLSGVIDSEKKANLLSDLDNLVKNKSQEMAFDPKGEASQNMKDIIENLAKENKKVI